MDSERRFMPLYAAFHTQDQQQDAYFAVKREPRIQSSTQRRDGLRSSYIGTEVYLSLVDPREAPFADDLQQVAVTALCSNRDLPVLVPRSSSGNDLQLQHSAPVDSIRVIKGPSRPMPANGQASSAWLLINQMTLNHVTLLDTDNLQGCRGPETAVAPVCPRRRCHPPALGRRLAFDRPAPDCASPPNAGADCIWTRCAT
jgi:type VI secretion system protein ImpG